MIFMKLEMPEPQFVPEHGSHLIFIILFPGFQTRWRLCFSLPAAGRQGEHIFTKPSGKEYYFFAHRIYMFYLASAVCDYPELVKLIKKLPDNLPVMGYLARNGIEE